MELPHRLIRVFRATIRSGSVTRAAILLNSSQPTISRDLARLEQVTGLRLFDRTGGRLHPTAAALTLAEEVERSFIGLEQISATARALRQFGEGRLAVACLPALAASLLPAVFARFLAEHPGVSLSLTALEPPAIDAGLTGQHFDLGIIEQQQPPPPETAAVPLLAADEVVLLPEGHVLLAKPMLTPQDFSGQPFISYSLPDPYRLLVDRFFAEQGVERRLGIEANSAAAVSALVRQGLGLAIVNPFTALEQDGRGVRWRPLTQSLPYRLDLVRPLRRPATPLFTAFTSLLRRLVAEKLAASSRENFSK
jgi:DNA-binding transcriptional LysR family regulator